LEEVIYFEAADKYVRVLTAEKEHLIRLSLRELLGQLDPQQFWQIHRGTVVQWREVAQALRDETGTLLARKGYVIGSRADLEAMRVQCMDQRFVQLEHRLPAGDNNIGRAADTCAPSGRHCISKRLWRCKLATSLSVGTDKVGVTELADRGCPVLFPPGPQIAAGKAHEHSSTARLRALPLQCQENFFDRIGHGRAA
jgi:hypothetical protein